jgi:hypothetical protein
MEIEKDRHDLQGKNNCWRGELLVNDITHISTWPPLEFSIIMENSMHTVIDRARSALTME